MSTSVIVASRIGWVLLLVGVGWALRRKEWLSAKTVEQLSRLVVDVCFPTLIFVEMLRTVRIETLATDITAMLAGVVVLFVGLLVGALIGRAAAAGQTRSTSTFLIAMPNWIFLPLLIAEAIYGNEGVRVILMINVGAQVMLWTAAISVLRGHFDRSSAIALLKNPGLLSTFSGIGVALAFPTFAELATTTSSSNDGFAIILSTLTGAAGSLGSMTVPLAMVVTGAQLGALDLRQLGPDRDVTVVLVGRLLIVPFVTAVVLVALSRAGMNVSSSLRDLALIVSSMPVAISASLFVQRFGGVSALAARTVTLSTILSIATVPLANAILERFFVN